MVAEMRTDQKIQSESLKCLETGRKGTLKTHTDYFSVWNSRLVFPIEIPPHEQPDT